MNVVYVSELRSFLNEYEDDDLILIMIHDEVIGSPAKQYRGYYNLRTKDDEGNAVLLIHKRK